MSELDMLVIPEQVEAEGGYAIATYFIETAVNTDIVKKIASIGIEQTTGTWVAVPKPLKFEPSMWPEW